MLLGNGLGLTVPEPATDPHGGVMEQLRNAAGSQAGGGSASAALALIKAAFSAQISGICPVTRGFPRLRD